MTLNEFWELLVSWAMKWGYLGAFVVSVIANATIILPVPYALAIFTLGTVLNPLILGVVGGTGAAIGELTGYALGAVWRGVLDESKKKQFEAARKLLDKSAGLAIFVFSATPLPVDVISIPVGMIGYPLWKTFLAFLAGKIVLCLTLAYSGYFFMKFLVLVGEAGGIWGMVGTVVAIAVLIALVLLIDWTEALRITDEEGWLGLLKPRNIRRLIGTIKSRRARKTGVSGGGRGEAEGDS